MVNKRRREARKKYREEHKDEIEEKSEQPVVKKVIKKKMVPRKKTNSDSKHPLRVAGFKPGDSCFICKSPGHRAKECSQMRPSDAKKVSRLDCSFNGYVYFTN